MYLNKILDPIKSLTQLQFFFIVNRLKFDSSLFCAFENKGEF